VKAELMAEISKLGARLDRLESRLDSRMDGFVTKAEFEKGLREQLKWLLLGWLTLFAAILSR
jgi:hypothetical protein